MHTTSMRSVSSDRRASRDSNGHRANKTCGFRRQCARPYEFADVEAGALAWRPPIAEPQTDLRHDMARRWCMQSNRAKLVLDSGGWCLGIPPDPSAPPRVTPGTASYLQPQFVRLDNGQSYFKPEWHVEADSLVVNGLLRLLRPKASRPHTLMDLGAGVGAYGHALLSRDPGLSVRSYDGAGNVEEATRGFVHFADLTAPLNVPRADYVLSIEVGEHVPITSELAYIRNIHAHACRGVIISWATQGQVGHGHINCHKASYVVRLFRGLGYVLNASWTRQMRGEEPRRRGGAVTHDARAHVWGWLRERLFVFDRLRPPPDDSCP